MSILLKGFKMPKACINAGCPIGGEYCELWWKPGGSEYGRHRDCPLIELPDHGDLVDRDEFISKLQSWALLIAMGHGDDDEWVKCIGEVCDRLYNDYVVIPADRSEE